MSWLIWGFREAQANVRNVIYMAMIKYHNCVFYRISFKWNRFFETPDRWKELTRTHFSISDIFGFCFMTICNIAHAFYLYLGYV